MTARQIQRRVYRRVRMKSKVVFFLTVVVCFLLQSTVMDLISIGSVTPNLMLVLCVSMGLMLYVHRLSERICPQNLL